VLTLAGCSSSSKTPSSDATSGGTTAATSGASSTSASGSQIVIASVGAETGAGDAASSTQQVGIDAWVQYTNAHGGISGHQIKLIKADSKGDPTVEASSFKQIDSADHPVAFVGYGAVNPVNPESFIDSSHIPVIGAQIADDTWDKDPYYFSQGTSNIVTYYSLAAAAKAAGATKLGIVYCAESPSCAQSGSNFTADASLLGSKVAYSQKLSLTTPDFTATCLAAKAAGVQAMLPIFDTPTNERFAAACAQQGFTPKYLWLTILPSDSVASAPGMEGALTTQTNLPWWVTTGAGATFHAAMSTYFPKAPIGPGDMQGWAAGALFEQAVEKVLQTPGAAITSASLVTALDSIQNTTLGGLSGPISFSTTSPKPLHFCWFSGSAQGGKWTQVGTAYSCASTTDQAALTNRLFG
jgi:branched-chain amino acid transport system substrate-binding protein